ncbi:Pogo transposable element with ZNF domain [Dirofilaria immitis]|nr:Pogo transposable element with ZNF domain [Dirofilaria immitis]
MERCNLFETQNLQHHTSSIRMFFLYVTELPRTLGASSIHLYFPKIFTNRCNDPQLSNHIPTVICSTMCVNLLEADVEAGVFIGFKFIRGCMDRVLRNGFNETAIRTHRFQTVNQCRSLPRAHLYNLDRRQLHPVFGDVQLCTCYGDRCNGSSNTIKIQMMKYPEIITLDNSDDDDSGGNSSLSRYVEQLPQLFMRNLLISQHFNRRLFLFVMTVSSVHSRTIDSFLEEFFDKRTAVSKLPPCTTVSHPFCRVRIPETPDTMILQRTSLSASHIEQQPRLELRNRAMLDTGNDTVDTTLPLSRTENNLDSYCYESYDPKAPPFEAQQFSAKFQCSVENCRMLLSNNISFMFHLWAHLTEFNYGTGLNCPREMHRFCRCPQCLHLFPTAYRLQIHYDNVHSVTPSSSTCKICEITVDESKHGRIHGDFDAPFHCRKCRYRTSMRSHFGRKLWLRKKKRKCAECNERLNNICEHFKRMYCCSHCDYRTNCHTATQLLPSLIVCNRCKRTSCIKRDILDHVRDCSGGRCIVIDLKQEKSNIFSQYNDELEDVLHEVGWTDNINGHIGSLFHIFTINNLFLNRRREPRNSTGGSRGFVTNQFENSKIWIPDQYAVSTKGRLQRLPKEIPENCGAI